MIYFFILTSNRWKLNLAYQMLSLPHLHSISTSRTFDWPFNFLPFCINCAFRQLFLNIILTIVNHLLFQNQISNSSSNYFFTTDNHCSSVLSHWEIAQKCELPYLPPASQLRREEQERQLSIWSKYPNFIGHCSFKVFPESIVYLWSLIKMHSVP